MGLGDALYVQSVARYFTERGERLKVATAWPDVFRPLAGEVEFCDFTRSGIDILAHYSARKPQPTRQWQDICITAGIKEPVELRLDWIPTTNTGLWLHEKANGKPIIAVQLPRSPMGRKDGFGHQLLPDCRVIQKLIDAMRGRAYLVQIGSGSKLFDFDGLDLDLSNRTTVCELIDVAQAVDGFLGYVSFIVPLAESLNKRSLLVWSSAGLKAPQPYVRQITPQKVLEKPSSRWVMDNAEESKLIEALNELL